MFTSDDGKSYSLIAREYYDSCRHPTCRNFGFLSRMYLRERADSICMAGAILEVGAGESAVAPLLQEGGFSLERLRITDGTEEMLRYSSHWQSKGAQFQMVNALSLGSMKEKFDVVVSSLGDPYNLPAFWEGVAEALNPGGLVAFTMPAFEWAAKYRQAGGTKGRHQAVFELATGQEARVPSYIPPLSDQISMMEGSGFLVEDFRALGLVHLASEQISSKINVFGTGPSTVIWGFLARKLNEPIGAAFKKEWLQSCPELCS